MMKSPLVLLYGLALLAPAFAQSRGTDLTPMPPETPVASTEYRYTWHAPRMANGRYRAEVWRRDAATGRDEIAWSSAPYLTMTEAMREACTTIQTIYDPNRLCPRTQQQQAMVAPRAADAKKLIAGPEKRKPVAKKTTDPEGRAGRTMARRPASGYEIPGCTFYALLGTKVEQHCPSAGTPGTKPFWYNTDAFEGGYGGGAY
jgi:hypothetical protein